MIYWWYLKENEQVQLYTISLLEAFLFTSK